MLPGQFVITVRVMVAVVIVMIIVTGTARQDAARHTEAAELDGSAFAQRCGHIPGRNEQAASQRRQYDVRQ